MNTKQELVIMHEKTAVTTSLKVAEIFGKEHKNVIQTIEDKIQSAENSADYKNMFAEGTYKDGRNREQKMYYMNRDGFSFIAFGFTGKKADNFKLQYIDAFNHMEADLKKALVNKPLTIPEQLQVIAQGSIDLDKRVASLESNMRVTGTQEHALQTAVNKRVMSILSGKESPAYARLSKSVFKQCWHDFKKRFELPRYGELPQLKFDDGLNYINAWLPDTETRIEIANLNAQTDLFD